MDSSSLIAFLEGDSGADVEAVDDALETGQAALPPVVLSELLSDPKLPPSVRQTLTELPLLDPSPGYWERAGSLRASLLRARRKARLADCLIAQTCIDAGVSLITRDRDFRHFQKHCGLRLA